ERAERRSTFLRFFLQLSQEEVSLAVVRLKPDSLLERLLRLARVLCSKQERAESAQGVRVAFVEIDCFAVVGDCLVCPISLFEEESGLVVVLRVLGVRL